MWKTFAVPDDHTERGCGGVPLRRAAAPSVSIYALSRQGGEGGAATARRYTPPSHDPKGEWGGTASVGGAGGEQRGRARGAPRPGRGAGRRGARRRRAGGAQGPAPEHRGHRRRRRRRGPSGPPSLARSLPPESPQPPRLTPLPRAAASRPGCSACAVRNGNAARSGALRPAWGPPGARPQPSGRGAPRLPCAVPNSRGVCRAAAIMASFLARDLRLLSAHAPPRCARSAPARLERPRRRTEDAASQPPFTAVPPGETITPRGQRARAWAPPPPRRPGPVVQPAGAVHSGSCSPHTAPLPRAQAHTPHVMSPSASVSLPLLRHYPALLLPSELHRALLWLGDLLSAMRGFLSGTVSGLFQKAVSHLLFLIAFLSKVAVVLSPCGWVSTFNASQPLSAATLCLPLLPPVKSLIKQILSTCIAKMGWSECELSC